MQFAAISSGLERPLRGCYRPGLPPHKSASGVRHRRLFRGGGSLHEEAHSKLVETTRNQGNQTSGCKGSKCHARAGIGLIRH
eukprot:5158726-Alexandrium_andersonii.AAC.1